MKLTQGCASGGCGAKIGPEELKRALKSLPAFSDPRLSVGFKGSDDAAVFTLNDFQSLIMTADFFPPMVEEPFLFGQIAAANALSDVYAMGGEPLVALNLVCFPMQGEWDVLGDILRGGESKLIEAGVALGGGHSIYDSTPKYGLSVTGIVETAHVLRNNTPRVGDWLILTKPLGTGIILAAKTCEMVSKEDYETALLSMQRLNMEAAQALKSFNVSACTDITGFGLINHGIEMAGERVALKINVNALPILNGALDYAGEYCLTAGGQRNRNNANGQVDVSGFSLPLQELLFDPQTSGGLLIAVAPHQGAELLLKLQEKDPWARIIGSVEEKSGEPVVLGG